MSDKEKIWKIFSILIGIVIISGLAYTIYLAQTNSIEQKNEKAKEEQIESSKYFADPERIIYKIKDENKYYIFRKGEDEYKEIIKQFYKSVTSKTDGVKLTQEEIDKIKSTEMFIEFDYNKVSKDFVFPLDVNGKNMIAMQEEGGQVYQPELYFVDKIKETINKNIENRDSYQMEPAKTYTGKTEYYKVESNEVSTLEKYDDNLYYAEIGNYEAYKLSTRSFKTDLVEENMKIDEETFKNNNVIVSISKYNIEEVKCNVGNIQFTFNGKVEKNASYKIYVTVVSKVPNIHCVYRKLNP